LKTASADAASTGWRKACLRTAIAAAPGNVGAFPDDGDGIGAEEVGGIAGPLP
jgi:hypothetical protein